MKIPVLATIKVYGYENELSRLRKEQKVIHEIHVQWDCSFPALPRVGNKIHFARDGEDDGIYHSNVRQVEWWPSDTKEDVLIPVVYVNDVKFESDDDTLTIEQVMNEARNLLLEKHKGKIPLAITGQCP